MRLNAGGALEEFRKLGERNRLLVVELTDRMTLAHQFCVGRDRLRGRNRKRFQVDVLAGPVRPHRRWRRDDVGIGIEPSQWVGLPAFRAVGVEQKIMKVPKYEVFVPLARPAAIAAADLEEDFAIHQQAEQFHPGKARLPPEPADLLRRGQRGNRASNF